MVEQPTTNEAGDFVEKSTGVGKNVRSMCKLKFTLNPAAGNLEEHKARESSPFLLDGKGRARPNS